MGTQQPLKGTLWVNTGSPQEQVDLQLLPGQPLPAFASPTDAGI